MIKMDKAAANTVIYFCLAGLFATHCQVGETKLEYNLDGGYNLTQNTQNQSDSKYPEQSYAQNFSSAVETMAIAILNYQDFSSSCPTALLK